MAIKPTIEEGKVTKIEIGNVQLPLKKNISFEELPKVVEKLEYLSQFIDFSKTGEVKVPRTEWTKEEAFDFLNNRNQRQITFFRILAEKGEIRRKDLIKEMKNRLNDPKFRGLILAGILAGIGIRTNRLNKEYLYEQNWKTDGWYYKLNEKYATIIEQWLTAQATVGIARVGKAVIVPENVKTTGIKEATRIIKAKQDI